MKRLFLRLFEFYIQASIHVALAVVSLYYVFTLSQKIALDVNLGFTLFFGTITGYNFVKYATIAKLHHRSLTRSLKVIQVFSFCCFLLMCFWGQKLSVDTWMVFGVIGVLTFLYAVPVIMTKNMRSVSGLKIYIVAICWGLVAVVAPVVQYGIPLNALVFLRFLQVVLLVIALIIPFDIRDLVHDSDQLKTIPQQLGVFNSKLIGVLLILVFYALEIYMVGWREAFFVLPMCLLTLGLLMLMPVNAPRYYCSFWVESVPIFYSVTMIFQLA